MTMPSSEEKLLCDKNKNKLDIRIPHYLNLPKLKRFEAVLNHLTGRNQSQIRDFLNICLRKAVFERTYYILHSQSIMDPKKQKYNNT
jgi:hypothetical protein